MHLASPDGAAVRGIGGTLTGLVPVVLIQFLHMGLDREEYTFAGCLSGD